MLSWPEALPLTATIVGLAFAGWKLIPDRKPPEPIHENREQEEGARSTCIVHAAVLQRLSDGDERMDQLVKNQQIIKNAVLGIAAHMKIPIDAIKDEIKGMVNNAEQKD